MLDYKIRTFIEVCRTMNYRKAAEILNMSQPSVTQHIQSLENYYGKRLFIYNGHRIEKTEYAKILEKYTLSQIHLEKEIEQKMNFASENRIKLGATKTIGNYVINNQIFSFLEETTNTLSFIIDNTRNLTALLKENEIDAALIEGKFDKSFFDYQLYKKEPYIGICKKNSILDGKEFSFEELMKNPIIVRENGSGTRAVLETELTKQNLSLDMFSRIDYISSFSYITELVSRGRGISFVYESLWKNNKKLGKFKVKNSEMKGEFNLIFPKNCKTEMITQIWNVLNKK